MERKGKNTGKITNMKSRGSLIINKKVQEREDRIIIQAMLIIKKVNNQIIHKTNLKN